MKLFALPQSIHKFDLSVWVSVCLFVSNKRQNNIKYNNIASKSTVLWVQLYSVVPLNPMQFLENLKTACTLSIKLKTVQTAGRLKKNQNESIIFFIIKLKSKIYLFKSP